MLAPAATAYHLSSLPDPGPNVIHDIRNRVLATNTVNLDNAGAGNLMTFTFPWDPEYSYADTGHTIRLTLHYTATYPQSSNGAWLINVAKEATGNLASCSIRVETIDPVGISLDALLAVPNWTIDCLFTQSTKVHYHTHTIYINRTVGSGSPAAMTAESLSVRLETEDVIILPNTHQNVTRVFDNLTDHRNDSLEVNGMSFDNLGFDGTILTLAWFVGLIWCLRRGKLLAAGVATVGVAVSGAPGLSDDLQLTSLLLFAVALWLEAIAHDRIYQRFLKPDKT